MKKEIGSEFWNVPIDKKNNYFSKEISWFLSGGNALRVIIKDIKEKRTIKTVSMPSWCCESMILPFIKEGIEVKFYPVFIRNGELYQDIDIEADIIFVMDYFGCTSNFDFSNSNKIVIRDLTHSIFSKKYNDANYYFGSLRKWAAFYTGGFAWKNGEWNISMNFVKRNDWYVNLRKKAMKEKLEYLSNQREDKKYLEIFNESENYLEKTDEIYLADTEDVERAKKLDISFIKNKRRQNAKYLLKNINFNDKIEPIFTELEENDVPLFLPILVQNRNELRKKLIENKIFCPIHWGISEYHKLNDKTRYIYEHELSIVCDQRYNIKDMEKICQIINDWNN